MSSPHVLIIGAGLGGLALAQALRKKGISYEIFDRDDSSMSRSQGYAIGLHGLFDDFRGSFVDDMPDFAPVSHLHPLNLGPEMCVYTVTSPGDCTGKFGVRDEPAGDKFVRANRSRLRDWLSTHIPIQFGKRAVRVEESEKGVTVHFEDGSCATGDILVGADGIRSVVRKHILKDDDPLEPFDVASFGADLELTGDDLVEQLRLGHSCYVVDITALCEGPAVLFVGLDKILPDEKSGSYYWFVTYVDDEAGSHKSWIKSASNEQLLDAARQKCKDVPPHVKAILGKTKPADMRPSIQFYTLQMASLPQSRMTLLGDAAHAMPPFRGEGGYHAIKDAFHLAKAIGKINDHAGTEGVGELLGEYQREMLPRGSEAARKSKEAFSQRGPGALSKGPVWLWGHPAGPLSDENIVL
ncbi:hypothetical protein F4778DRAFT_783772 [Xylariomycetidae sp. FL2044]|nr:hypothetical protein F4778DRAFT_783772 [Xylariomycetidae sp. FL2044]